MRKNAILIASDFYGRSDLALQRGILLAAQQGANVKLMSVVNDTIADEFAGILVEKTRHHLRTAARKLGKCVESEITVEKGDPVARFLELMDTTAIDLVVVGRHHKRGFFDDLNAPTVFWSIAAKCQSPVLLVTQPVEGAYRRVLVPTAFSSACHRAVVSAHNLAPDASFRICHVDPLQNERANAELEKSCASSLRQGIEAKIRRWTAELPPALTKVDIINDRVVPGVQQAIAEFQPDLLAIGARKCDVSRTGLGRYASKLLRDPPTDLLVCRRSSGD